MLGEVRQKKLLDLLRKEKAVRIRDLTDTFSVSEETIRRDLRKLELDGLLRRTHGGAMLEEEVHTVPPISQRTTEQIEAKHVIAAQAATLVTEGSSVMLDSGSTTLEIARKLADRNITVITNELTIAMELSTSLHVNLMVLGGTFQKGSYTLVGPECEEDISHYNVDYVFLGAGGISMQKGLTTSSVAEVEVKRKMMRAGRNVYCVADSSKFGRTALVSYADLSEVTGIITDKLPQSDLQGVGASFLYPES